MGELAELADLLETWRGKAELYVRWTDDIDRDMRTGTSRDELTGVELPGLSANCLHLEQWWGERGLHSWLARRLYDYRHLSETRGPDTRPWVVSGIETGRGPDNEPLIAACEPIAELDLAVIDQATREVDRLGNDWGSMRRS